MLVMVVAMMYIFFFEVGILGVVPLLTTPIVTNVGRSTNIQDENREHILKLDEHQQHMFIIDNQQALVRNSVW